jgi:hypothetical protein
MERCVSPWPLNRRDTSLSTPLLAPYNTFMDKPTKPKLCWVCNLPVIDPENEAGDDYHEDCRVWMDQCPCCAYYPMDSPD